MSRQDEDGSVGKEQRSSNGTHTTPEQLKAWRDGLQERVRTSCVADGMSSQTFATAFSEIIQAISD